MAGEELTAFERAALDARGMLEGLGPVVGRMEELYVEAMLVSDELGKEMRLKGEPKTPRAYMEINLLGLWAQACAEFGAAYLSSAIRQGAEMGRLPKGPQVVDPRSNRH